MKPTVPFRLAHLLKINVFIHSLHAQTINSHIRAITPGLLPTIPQHWISNSFAKKPFSVETYVPFAFEGNEITL